MGSYKHIFFDLDHTLWDYDTNAREALFELYDRYDFRSLDLFSKSRLAEVFFEANDELWDLYNHHRIQRSGIRERRFKMIFERLGAEPSDIPNGIEEAYISLAPTKEKTFPNAHEVLEYLRDKYKLHIITNGFDDIQAAKLQSSQLTEYFNVIVTSESAGDRKPSVAIFEYAMNQANARLKESMMIGDNLDSDIAGAQNVGMDHVWFNPQKISTKRQVQHEIENLIQLKTIL